MCLFNTAFVFLINHTMYVIEFFFQSANLLNTKRKPISAFLIS